MDTRDTDEITQDVNPEMADMLDAAMGQTPAALQEQLQETVTETTTMKESPAAIKPATKKPATKRRKRRTKAEIERDNAIAAAKKAAKTDEATTPKATNPAPRANYGPRENGRTCFKCGSAASSVNTTRATGDLVLRYRTCDKCGQKRVTQELL